MTDRLAAAVTELVAASREEIETLQVTKPNPELHSVDAAAQQLGLGRSIVYDMIGKGHLRTLKVGRRRLVPADALVDFVQLAKLGLDKAPDRTTRYTPRDVRRGRRASAGTRDRIYERFPRVGRRDRDFVFERDHWRCGICHGPIDPALVYPDPGSASLDHIDPNGPHQESNWQASHLRCNVVKGKRVAREPTKP